MPQMESAVNLRRHYSDVELIISCGDMPSVYLEFITSVLNAPLFYVRGNHDDHYTERPPGGENLHQRLVKHGGLSFYGLEGSMRYNDAPIQFTDAEMMGMVVGAGVRLGYRRWRHGHGIDVLVTHSPARGIHDMEDLPHTGFQSLVKFMEWYRPRYMLHGHVHTWDRRTTVKSQFLDTCIMNINPVTVIDIEPESAA